MMIKKSDAPDPGTYKPVTSFSKDPKGKAFSFGIPHRYNFLSITFIILRINFL